MNKTGRGYTPEFKAEAIKMVEEQGIKQVEAARMLGIPEGTLAGWRSPSKRFKQEPVLPGKPAVTDLEAENSRLRKELSEAKMERDILKKAAAYFARESMPGTRS